MNEETKEINEILAKKFPTQNNENYFRNYYQKILKFINNNKKSITYVLEGQHIYRFLEPYEIKGKLLIKRTAIFKCWKRSIIRDIKSEKLQLKNKEITRKQFYKNSWYWIKRRTKQLEYYKDFNIF